MASAPKKPIPGSILLAQAKARAQRVQRLTATLEQRLDNPIAAVDALMNEIGEGDEHALLWGKLHAAADRDGVGPALGDAYVKCIAGPRMKRLKAEAQAAVLMHAADYFQTSLKDEQAAEGFLERVVSIEPSHVEAFTRLEQRLEKLLDSRRLLSLYANVAASPPENKPANVLATQATNRLLQLRANDPLPEDACEKLVVLVPTNPKLLDALEAHCRETKRLALAATLIEKSLAAVDSSSSAVSSPPPNEAVVITQRRYRLLDLYMGEVANPTQAMVHAEKLLERDATDAKALNVTERLLSSRGVASRAAASLRNARRTRGY